MGQKSDTIYNEAIRYFLAVQNKVIVAGSDAVPADFHVPDGFDLKKQLPKFQRKVYRKMLDSFIVTFEEENLRTLPIDTIMDIEDGLNMVRGGFFSLKENDSTDKNFKIELSAVNQDLLAVHEPLKKALAYVSAAIFEFEDNGGKKTAEYILSLQDCRDKMSEIKMQLRAWLE